VKCNKKPQYPDRKTKKWIFFCFSAGSYAHVTHGKWPGMWTCVRVEYLNRSQRRGVLGEVSYGHYKVGQSLDLNTAKTQFKSSIKYRDISKMFSSHILITVTRVQFQVNLYGVYRKQRWNWERFSPITSIIIPLTVPVSNLSSRIGTMIHLQPKMPRNVVSLQPKYLQHMQQNVNKRKFPRLALIDIFVLKLKFT
jgi:hypothetical protein